MLAVLYLVLYDTLLQNATDIVTNAITILLQNATKIYYKMCPVVYYEIRLFYYKLRQSFQNALILLQNASVQTVHKVDVSRKRPKKKYFTFNFYCSEQSTKVSLKA